MGFSLKIRLFGVLLGLLTGAGCAAIVVFVENYTILHMAVPIVVSMAMFSVMIWWSEKKDTDDVEALTKGEGM